MPICTKCNIEKPIDQYDTYWHSTQNKTRTRRYCKVCYKKQKDEYKLKKILEQNPQLIYQNNPDYSQCKQCREWKHKDEFYLVRGKINHHLCKQCTTNKERAERQIYLKENCGSDFIHRDVNTYTDEYQKACVFNFMEYLGYLYDDSTGIWTKPGVKEIIDGEIVFLGLKKQPKKQRKKSTPVTTKIIKEVLQLKKNNVKMIDIINQVGISENSVYKILKTYSNAESS